MKRTAPLFVQKHNITEIQLTPTFLRYTFLNRPFPHAQDFFPLGYDSFSLHQMSIALGGLLLYDFLGNAFKSQSVQIPSIESLWEYMF